LRFLLALLALAGLVASGALTGATVPAAAGPASQPRMFAYYYLWWSTAHWRERLGSNYPYGSKSLPLPATLDSTGCGARSRFAGNTLTDVPAQLWTQDSRATIERDVRQAMAAGLTGFAVNWVGTGATNQTANSISYSRRLDILVRVVNQVRSEGHTFSLWISYKSSARKRSTTTIANDLAYLHRTYGGNPAFDRSNGNRPTLILMGSRKYGASELTTISRVARPHFYLVGDETPTSWTAARAALLDGNHYYWSSQNPVANPQSFDQLATLAKKVHAGQNPDGSRKGWFAPLAPGYNKEIGGGRTCVPRRGGQTLRDLYAGNARTAPDAWLLISWNEITEGTHVVPLQRYASQSLDMLRAMGRVAG
jgi:hypothetical protein